METIAGMAVFTRVVESGSLAAAAEALDMTPAAVAEAIAGLEDRLGARLFKHSARRLRPTPIGRAFYKRSARLLDDARQIEADLAEQPEWATAALKVVMPVDLGCRYLALRMAKLLHDKPSGHLTLTLGDATIASVAADNDVVICVGGTPGDGYVSELIARCERVVCARPDYLAPEKRPTHPLELTQLPCLSMVGHGPPKEWQFEGPGGRFEVRVDGPLSSDNSDLLRAAVLDRQGIGLLPLYACWQELDAGDLVQLLDDYTPPPIEIYAAALPSKHRSGAVRHLIALIGHALGTGAPWRRNQKEITKNNVSRTDSTLESAGW